MIDTFYKRAAILCCAALLLLANIPVANADPAPTQYHADTVDAHSILIYWADNPLAESYRIYRDHVKIAEVGETVDQYLDTNLQPARIYRYELCSVTGGVEYFVADPAWLLEIALGPASITGLSYEVIDNENLLILLISTEPAEGQNELCNVYRKSDDEPDFSKVIGDYLGWTMADTVPLPETSITFRYLVGSEFLKIVGDEEIFVGYGPLSEPWQITYYPVINPIWLKRFYFRAINPWPDPVNERWQRHLLDTFGDMGSLNEDEIESSLLASLAKNLESGQTLAKSEELLANMIHPTGLLLLRAAFSSPPAADTANELTRILWQVSSLLAGRAPEELVGKDVKTYLKLIKEAFQLFGMPYPNLTAVPAYTPSPTQYHRPTPTPTTPLRTIFHIPFMTPLPTLHIVTRIPGAPPALP